MRFIKSFCTNTRLMGTMMLMIEWSRNNKVVSHVFMLDAEGLGVSDFYSYDDLTVEERETFYKKKYGGLGGTNVNLTESEAVFLVIHYINKNINYNKSLPEKMSKDIVDFYMKSQGESLEQEILQYEGMCCYENCEKDKNFKKDNQDSKNSKICQFSEKVLCGDEEKQVDSKRFEIILGKICKNFESDVEFVQYIIMRLVARDREALYYYSHREEVSNLFISEINGTLLYSKLEKLREGVFMSYFIYEDRNSYYQARAVVNFEKNAVKDELTYDSNKIDNIHEKDLSLTYLLRSIMILEKSKIDESYVELIMEKQEMVDVYDFDTELEEDFVRDIIYQKFSFIQEIDFYGEILYTQYFPDNTHVEDSIYRINSDIMFNLFIRNKKLYVFSYEDECREFVHSFIVDIFVNKLKFSAGFDFESSILLDFINSDSDDIFQFTENCFGR